MLMSLVLHLMAEAGLEEEGKVHISHHHLTVIDRSHNAFITLYCGWIGDPVQYPVTGEIRPFFSYPVSGLIPNIRPDIRQTGY